MSRVRQALYCLSVCTSLHIYLPCIPRNENEVIQNEALFFPSIHFQSYWKLLSSHWCLHISLQPPPHLCLFFVSTFFDRCWRISWLATGSDIIVHICTRNMSKFLLSECWWQLFEKQFNRWSTEANAFVLLVLPERSCCWHGRLLEMPQQKHEPGTESKEQTGRCFLFSHNSIFGSSTFGASGAVGRLRPQRPG